MILAEKCRLALFIDDTQDASTVSLNSQSLSILYVTIHPFWVVGRFVSLERPLYSARGQRRHVAFVLDFCFRCLLCGTALLMSFVVFVTLTDLFNFFSVWVEFSARNTTG
jgi:hypothetical protein